MGLLSEHLASWSLVCTLILLFQGSALSKKVLHHQRCSIGENKVELLNDCACELRRQVVPIPRNKSLDMFIPTTVEVKRCSGGCPKMRYCTASVVENKCVLVHIEKKDVYKYIEVEEHLECICCETAASACNEKQVFDAKDCSCKCIDEYEVRECGQKKGIWDRSNCLCVCPEHACLSSQTYSQQDCSCVEKEKRHLYFA